MQNTIAKFVEALKKRLKHNEGYVMEPTLMRNSSQNAGCMRRSPASHCCQVRQVVCTSAPADVWDKPAASREARISSGSGFDKGPFGPRFGWLDIAAARRLDVVAGQVDDVVAIIVFGDHIKLHTTALAKGSAAGAAIDSAELGTEAKSGLPADLVHASEPTFCDFHRTDSGFGVVEFVREGDGLAHFLLQPLNPEARFVGVDNLNNTRNARNCNKNVFMSGRRGAYGAKPSNAELSGPRPLAAEGSRSNDGLGTEGKKMSLFQCGHCGCCENTALSGQGCDGYSVEFFDWTGFEDRKGKTLCSACAPTKYADGTPTEYGQWRGRFDRVFLPTGMFKTAKNGNLAHVETGDEDFLKYKLPNA